MASESAFSRAGLSRISQPLAPSRLAMILAVSVVISSYHLALAQRRDLCLAEAQARQHILCRFPRLGRGPAHPARRAGECHRLAYQPNLAQSGMAEATGNAEVLHLRIGEDLVDPVDRAAGHAGPVQPFDPVAPLALLQLLRHGRDRGGAVLLAQLVAGEAG